MTAAQDALDSMALAQREAKESGETYSENELKDIEALERRFRMTVSNQQEGTEDE